MVKTKKTDELPISGADWAQLLHEARFPVLDDRCGSVVDMDLVASIGESNGEYCAIVIKGLAAPVVAQLIPARTDGDDPFLATKALVESVRERYRRYRYLRAMYEVEYS